MDERDITLFQSLMETRNITKSAQSLYMTQSAITKRLHKLEDELGVPLFIRTVKGLIPTPSADNICQEMDQLQTSLLKIRSQSQYAAGHITGSLKIGVSVNYARYVLPPILKQYMTDFPNVQIEVTTGQSLNLYQQLQRHQLFLAVIRGVFSWTEESRLLSEERVYAVTSPENQDIPFSRLPYIYRRSDRPFMARTQRWKAENNILDTTSLIEVNDIAACLAIVLSFCPKFSAIISAMPAATIGGVSLVLYGMISAVGVRNVVENRVDFTASRNVIIAALILVLAIGIKYGANDALSLGFTSLSGLAVAAIVGVVLNAVLPGKDYTFGDNELGDKAVDFEMNPSLRK